MAADHLLGCQSPEAQGRRVGVGDAQLGVERVERVGNGIEDAPA